MKVYGDFCIRGYPWATVQRGYWGKKSRQHDKDVKTERSIGTTVGYPEVSGATRRWSEKLIRRVTWKEIVSVPPFEGHCNAYRVQLLLYKYLERPCLYRSAGFVYAR